MASSVTDNVAQEIGEPEDMVCVTFGLIIERNWWNDSTDGARAEALFEKKDVRMGGT